MEADLRRQEAALDRKVGELTGVGSRLEGAQARADEASARIEDLAQQARRLRRDREAQERAVAESRSTFEERLAAAYKDQDFQSIVLLIADLFGGADHNGVLDGQAVRILMEDRESIRHYKENERLLAQTAWQLEGRTADLAESQEEQRALAEEFERREAELEGSISELRGQRGRTRGELDDLARRIEELEQMEQAGLLEPPASGGEEIRGRRSFGSPTR